AYVLLHHYMGEIDGAFRAWGFCKGGNGTISQAIARAALEKGAEIRTEAPVRQVLLERGRAVGVVLGSGEECRAPVIVSGLDARLHGHHLPFSDRSQHGAARQARREYLRAVLPLRDRRRLDRRPA